MVFVPAVLSENGPAARAFAMAENHAIELFVGAAVLDEVAEVLERPRLRAKSRRLTFQRIDQFLDRIRRIATWVRDGPQVVRLIRDPKDEAYLNLAIAANAEYIVTRDRDLLDLNSKREAASALPDRLRIVTPEEFLSLVRIQGPEA
jgi:uncharacterized protein